MQNDIIAKIDALVKMSESTSNVATMKVELRELEVEIKEKKFELKDLESSISDDKYFDATGEIVDKNIEISLTKKIRFLNKSLGDLEVKVSDVKEEEQKRFNEVESLKKDIDEATNFIDVLGTKISSENTKDKENFEKLLKETEEKLKDSKNELDKAQKEYEKVQSKLEMLSYSKKELESKLEEDTEKLIDVKSNLLNKRGYVNAELKQEDEEKIDKLESELKELEDAKNELLSDPVMIAEDAKNYLLDDDKTAALNKIKELRDIILTQPYMDLDSNTSSETLNAELNNAEAKRDEFASMISSKNYESVDTTLIKDRITYIKDKKEKLAKEIDGIRKEIKEYDTKDLEDLNNRINYCEDEVKNIKEKLIEYDETLKNSDLTMSKKASLQASYDKKQEELNNVTELLNLYRNDRRTIILKSFDLETVKIKDIEDQIAEIDKEIKKLERLCVSTNKAKDIIAVENDKKTLKELNDTVKAIKKRKSLKVTPNELYDEIEVLLGTDATLDNKDTDEIKEESIYIDEMEPEEIEPLQNDIEEDSLDDYIKDIPVGIDTNVVEDINDFTINTDEVKEEEPVIDYVPEGKDEIEEVTPLEDINIEPINDVLPDDIKPVEDYDNLDFSEIDDEDNNKIEEIKIDDLPTVNDDVLDMKVTDINTDSDKLKVINVEPLDNTTEEEIKEEDNQSNDEFLIGDYKSEDVI